MELPVNKKADFIHALQLQRRILSPYSSLRLKLIFGRVASTSLVTFSIAQGMCTCYIFSKKHLFGSLLVWKALEKHTPAQGS